MTIEEELINSLSHKLIHFSQKRNSFKFQCPYCQYGRMNRKGKAFTPSEASGYLYEGKDGWNFKCHREKHCGRGTSFAVFLEENFPSEFLNYVRLREEQGTAGYQTNCPSLATALKRSGTLPNHPPRFHDPSRTQNGLQPPPEAPAKASEVELMPKITKLPPMTSPQQQAGHQAAINQLIKQREKRRREISGELW